MMMVKSEPINSDQAMNDSNWLAAMTKELKAFEKNETWELVERSNKRPIDVKWGLKIKLR